jgi:hypothetical protein
MSLNPYDQQQLALQAYGSITADGLTVQNQGCVLARTGAGVYTLTLNADSGVVDGQSMTDVTAKDTTPPGPTPPVVTKVEETSNLVKTIRVFNLAGAPTDSAIEVKLYKSLINPSGP